MGEVLIGHSGKFLCSSMFRSCLEESFSPSIGLYSKDFSTGWDFPYINIEHSPLIGYNRVPMAEDNFDKMARWLKATAATEELIDVDALPKEALRMLTESELRIEIEDVFDDPCCRGNKP